MLSWLLYGLLFASSPAQASEVGDDRPFGLGVMVGYPTAISGKYYLQGTPTAIDAAIASASYDWGSRGGVYLHGTYLWHPSVVVSVPEFDMPWHVGVGGVIWSHYWGWRGRDMAWYGGTAAGVRVPVGLDLNLNAIPLQFFGDASANVFVTPGLFIDIGVSLGARYYF